MIFTEKNKAMQFANDPKINATFVDRLKSFANDGLIHMITDPEGSVKNFQKKADGYRTMGKTACFCGAEEPGTESVFSAGWWTRILQASA